MLESILQSYKSVCDCNPKIMKLNKNKLFDLYLDSTDDIEKEEYMSAIIYKYWYQVGYIYKDNFYYLTEEECYDALIKAIFSALKYQPWRKEGNKLYKNPKGPHIALQQCLKSNLATTYILGNLDKHKNDFGRKKISWDFLLEENKDSIYNDIKYTFDDLDSTCQLNILIKNVSERLGVGNGIIIDLICYSNTEEYSKRKIYTLIRQLKEIKDDYSLYYSSRYNIDFESVKESLNKLVDLRSDKLGKLIDKTLKWVELKGGYSKDVK